MRRLFILTHRWTALITGIILFFTAASGASLVFEGAIDRALNASLWRADGSGATLPLDSLIMRVRQAFPGKTVGSMNLSTKSGRAWTVSAGPLSVFVNPYTGHINGTRTAQQSQATFARRLHVLHVELFAGKIGRSVVGLACIVALFLVVSGVVIWWRDKLVRINTGASWKRINFDLHHAFGIGAAAVLIVMTMSGLLVHYDALSRAVRSLDSTPPPSPPHQPAPAVGTERDASFDALFRAAHSALPGADVMFVSLGTAKNPVTIAMRFPEDHTPAGRSRVFLDRYSATVLATSSTRDAQIGTKIDNLKRSLHTGDVFGKPTEIVWLIATLFMLSQIVTGVLMWWNARRGRMRTL